MISSSRKVLLGHIYSLIPLKVDTNNGKTYWNHVLEISMAGKSQFLPTIFAHMT